MDTQGRGALERLRLAARQHAAHGAELITITVQDLNTVLGELVAHRAGARHEEPASPCEAFARELVRVGVNRVELIAGHLSAQRRGVTVTRWPMSPAEEYARHLAEALRQLGEATVSDPPPAV